MTGNHPPYKGITEAKEWAAHQGFEVFSPGSGCTHPVHFAISDRGCVSLVCVRYPKYRDFNTGHIEYSCRTEIAKLRALAVTGEIFREIWVRKKREIWYRYLVLAGSIEELI
ncbi:MAG: hypothetical protein LUQ31_02470 [Methanoregula sp.]|nr:hypothetical protein [Methanoregula sp.]